ncbi:hypothetical protein OGZ01_12645 [Vibrio harveyi]|nr:hypothetical protein [Vibrio harveyi]
MPENLEQWLAMGWIVIGLTSVVYGAYVYTIPLITTNELSFFGTFNPDSGDDLRRHAHGRFPDSRTDWCDDINGRLQLDRPVL